MQPKLTTQPGRAAFGRAAFGRTQPGPYSDYYGGKSGAGVYQTIINYIRPHDTYMELFVGNGGIFRAKRLAGINILNDLNDAVMRCWAATNGPDTAAVLYNDCAIEFLASYRFDEDKQYCIYLDPPYPISTRREGKPRYECEMSDDDHRQLLQVIRYLPDNVDVLISTYNNPIYSELLYDWHLVTFQAQTRQGPATEYLYMNYVPDGTLHDYRYLGTNRTNRTNRTDRQRIRRKISREIARLKQLPAAERNAIIAAVLASVDKPDSTGAKTNPTTAAPLPAM